MADPKKKPDAKTFMEDPAFQGERDIFNAAIDARLGHHAEEAKKKRDAEIAANGDAGGDMFAWLDVFSPDAE